jgi:hypothetical protein
VFGKRPHLTVRYFPDNLPIGYDRDHRRHVFMYLARSPSPMDFRVFILRHLELLNALGFWTIRVLFPRSLAGSIEAYRKDVQKIPMLKEFALRFLDGYAKANRLKPSGIASKETVLRVHLARRRSTRRFDCGRRAPNRAARPWRNSGGGGKIEVKESVNAKVGLPAVARN